MNKQIEELANVIHKGELDRNKGVLDCTEFTTDLVVKVGLQRLAGAKALYTAGYRRQDEVAREIFTQLEEEIEAALASNYKVYEKYLNEQNPYADPTAQRVGGKIDVLRGMQYFIEELKKKYIGEQE